MRELGRRHGAHPDESKQALALLEGHHSWWPVGQLPAINGRRPLLIEQLLELAVLDVGLVHPYALEFLSHRANDRHDHPPFHVLHPLDVLHEMPTSGDLPAAAVQADHIVPAELPQVFGEYGVEVKSDVESAA